MTSEIRVNKLTNRVGLGTVEYTNTGIVVSGISTSDNFKTGTSNLHSTGLNIFDLDVDGHTNLDNVSVVGVTTITANNVIGLNVENSSGGGAQTTIRSKSTVANASNFVRSESSDNKYIGLLKYGTGHSAYGALAAGGGAVYANSSVPITIMSDGGYINFATGGNTERVRITSNGNILVGKTTDSGKGVEIYASNNAALRVQNSHTGVGAGDGLLIETSFSDALIWNYENSNTRFATAGIERLRITSGGVIQISQASPQVQFIDSDGTNQLTQILQSGAAFYIDLRDNTNDGQLIIRGKGGDTATERLRIDSSGKSRFIKDAGSTNNAYSIAAEINATTSGSAAANFGPALYLTHTFGGTNYAGSLITSQTDADVNTTHISFYPRNYGWTEALRIASDGDTTINSVNDKGLFVKSNGNNASVRIRATGSTDAGGFRMNHNAPTSTLAFGRVDANGAFASTLAVISSSGYVTKPYQVAWSMHGTTTQTITGGTKLAFNTQGTGFGSFSNRNHSGVDTTNHSFTVPVTGLYSITVTVFFYTDNNTSTCSLVPFKNGSAMSNGSDTIFILGASAVNANITYSGTVLLQLNANDEITIHRRPGEGGNSRVYLPHSYFAGFLVG